jgi:hypothetical protein
MPSGPYEIPAPSSSTPLSVLFREDSMMTPYRSLSAGCAKPARSEWPANFCALSLSGRSPRTPAASAADLTNRATWRSFNRSGTDMTAAIDHAAKDRTVRDARELQPGLKRGHRKGEIGGCPLCANSPAIRRREPISIRTPPRASSINPLWRRFIGHRSLDEFMREIAPLGTRNVHPRGSSHQTGVCCMSL